MLNYNVGILVLWNHAMTDVMLMLAVMQEGASVSLSLIREGNARGRLSVTQMTGFGNSALWLL